MYPTLDGLYGALLACGARLDVDLVLRRLYGGIFGPASVLHECRPPRSYPLLQSRSRIVRNDRPNDLGEPLPSTDLLMAGPLV
jgi:hypothetical protein